MGTGHGRELSCLYYALGGGLGHLTRAVAFARRARDRAAITILTNSPFARAVHETGVEFVRLAPNVTPDEVLARIDALRFDTIVVDTFPRGLGGELVALLDRFTGRKYLVHRDLDPRYVAARSLGAWIDRYDRIFVPGEDAPFSDHPRAIRTAPWFVRDAEELLDRKTARSRLGLALDRAAVAVLASGRLEEGEHFLSVARALRRRIPAEVVLVSPSSRPQLEEARAVWPLLEVIRAFDVLVGAGGYNTVQEARATNTPLVGWALRRRYDRQARRLGATAVAGIDEAVSAVLEHLSYIDRPSSSFTNGTHRAVDTIFGRSVLA